MMKTKICSQSAIFNPGILLAFALGSVGVLLTALSFAANPPGGLKTPSASSARASAFVDNHAVPLKGDAAAPASSMSLAATGPAWSIVTSPNNATFGTIENHLNDVACASASDCWAVGGYAIYTKSMFFPVHHSLIEHWNGAAWSIVSSPDINDLSGVACASALDCWAVGFTGFLTEHTLIIEHWNGTAWSIVTSPNTSATQSNRLFDVTCASASDCWAVGFYDSGNVGQTLIEHWNGTAWSIVPSPNATQTNALYGVTCASASDCWAVGAYNFNSADPVQTLIEHWNGTAWSIVKSPNTSAAQENLLEGTTCSSASDCWAVGFYGSVRHTLIEHWNGASWSIVSSPNGSAHDNFLERVTCSSASDCWGVGFYYIDRFETSHTLIENWNGTAWSIVKSPNTGALSGVTCNSAADCWAVGDYFDSGDNVYHTLIERYSPCTGRCAPTPRPRPTPAPRPSP
jgi:hypothetical protein